MPEKYPYYLINIEGNIGSGKSTFLEYVKANCKTMDTYYNFDVKVVILPEPVAEWESYCDPTGKTILELFYENKTENAFSFQMMAFVTRYAAIMKIIESAKEPIIIISERSIQTDRDVFAKMMADDGAIRGIDHKIYLNYFNLLSCNLETFFTFYIRTDPEICQSRVKSRNRAGEEHIELSYLQKCHEYHDAMVAIISDESLLTMSGNDDISQFENWLQTLRDAIDLCQ